MAWRDSWRSGVIDKCYRRAFELVQEHELRSIAFPGISTGVYGYPKDQACRIALTVMLDNEVKLDRIIACCFSAADEQLYQSTLALLRTG